MLKRVIAAGLAILSVAVGSVAASESRVTGSVTYRERIALPPEAVLEVKLVDVSLQDAPAKVISEQTAALTGVPAAFSLPYDPALVSERQSYAVQARIVLKGRLMFINTSRYPVLTDGAGTHVDMVLERVAASQTSLSDTDWTVVALAGRPVKLDRPPTLSFGAGGAVAVFGGCNRFAGQVDVADGSLSFADNMAGTLMACPPDIQAFERQVLEALQSASRFESDGRHLVVSDRDGFVLLRARAGL